MPTKAPPAEAAATIDPAPAEQLLGELSVSLRGCGRPRPSVAGTAGPPTGAPDDEQQDLLAHLPERVAAWLRPLVERGEIRVQGRVAASAGRPWTVDLSVFLPPGRGAWLAREEVRDGRDALHEIVRHAWRACQDLTNPQAVRDAAEALRPLERHDLRPETRLLLALLDGVARECQAAKAVDVAARFRALVAEVVVLPVLPCGPLALFPLAWPSAADPSYLLLKTALESGLAEVQEVSDDGSVPNLRLVNRGAVPLLVPEGEVLVGAKQNRVVNATVLVPAGATFVLPVSCVEQGRWGYQTRPMHSAFCAPPSLRSKKMRSVHRNRRERGRTESDQGAVWAEVACCLDELGVRSDTASLADGFAHAAAALEPLRRSVRLPEGAAGVLVARGERVLGVDLFDAPPTFAALWPRIADAYLFDALRRTAAAPAGPPPPAAVPDFLESIVGAARLRPAALGLGDELEIAGQNVVGAALVYAGRLCHLAAFAETAAPE